MIRRRSYVLLMDYLLLVFKNRSEKNSGRSGLHVTVIPSPSCGAVTLYVKGLKGFASIRIYDTLSRCVHGEDGWYTGMTDTSLGLPSGCYFINIECEGKRHTSKFTIAK
jgi:hypothetical protein